MLTCFIYDSSVINLTYSEQLQFSHSMAHNQPLLELKTRPRFSPVNQISLRVKFYLGHYGDKGGSD
jgi:hypothetical protein